MESRTIHAVRIKLRTVAERSVIIWPKDTSKLCVRLMNPRRTWMTARAGDALILTNGGVKSRKQIEAVELYRVFPSTQNAPSSH